MEPVIRLSAVTKRYVTQRALDGVSFEVPPGVVFALLGENGAGKTTSIRVALGLTEPDAGQATVLGLSSRQQGLEIRRRVGYVSERPALYDWMSVDEIGWFTAGFYPEGFAARYRELVAAFQLAPHQQLKTLSKGMRAKVSLALALGHDPELLILDEPTSGLDAIVRREFLESMVDRAAQGKTVFLSSHQPQRLDWTARRRLRRRSRRWTSSAGGQPRIKRSLLCCWKRAAVRGAATGIRPAGSGVSLEDCTYSTTCCWRVPPRWSPTGSWTRLGSGMLPHCGSRTKNGFAAARVPITAAIESRRKSGGD